MAAVTRVIGSGCQPGRELHPLVDHALPEVAQRVLEELQGLSPASVQAASDAL